VTSKLRSLDALVVPALLQTVRPVFQSCHKIVADLAETIPRDEVWRWKDLWANPLRAAVFSVVFEGFLVNGTLVPLVIVAGQLGSTFSHSRFHVRH
jgi:hypothetical protein